MQVIFLIIAGLPLVVALVLDLRCVRMQLRHETVTQRRHAITALAALMLFGVVLGSEYGFSEYFTSTMQQQVGRIFCWTLGLGLLAIFLRRRADDPYSHDHAQQVGPALGRASTWGPEHHLGQADDRAPAGLRCELDMGVGS